MLKKILFILLFILFSVFPVMGNIDITFNSENNKTISIIKLNNISNITTLLNNENVSLEYTNYKIVIYPNTSLNHQKFIRNLNYFNSDWMYIIWVAIILLIFYFGYGVIKKL